VLALAERLEAVLSRTVEQRLSGWSPDRAKPTKLAEAVETIRRQVGDFSPATNDPGLVDAAVARLIEHGAAKLRTRHDIHLAANLAASIPRLADRSLCDEPALLGSLLKRWTEKVSTSSLGDLIWLGVFHTYFKLETEALLQTFRSFLRPSFRLLKRTEFTSPKIAAIERQPGLLDARPAQRFAQQWLKGDDSALQQLKTLVEIPDRSWFWDAYLDETLDSVCALPDTAFVAQIDRALNLTGVGSRGSDHVLVRIVNRLAESGSRSLHPGLLEALLNAWGSPQLNLSDRAHRWAQASQRAREMICQWIAEDDLKDFFELIRSTRALESMDERRFKFWQRYTGQMSYTKLILAPSFRYNSNPDVRRFVGKRRDRLAWLNATTSDNVAIVMKLGDWWFVEFSQTGNACYGYHATECPFEIDAASHTIHSLKRRGNRDHWLVHRANWEETFAEVLRGCGTHPDRPGKARARPASSTHTPERLVPTGIPRLTLPADCAAELERLQARTVDNTAAGGRFWIETRSDPSPRLRAALEAAGFRFAQNRGFYR